MIYKTIIITLAGLSLFGCAGQYTNQKPQISKSNLTAGQVSLTLKKGVTTQAEVLQTFGAPNIVTQNSSGEDIWEYQRQATVTNSTSNSAYATIIFFGAASRSSGLEESSKTITLIIKFRAINGIKTVVGFSSRYTSF